ncbi:MAG: futalosine hydrolase [Saprospiraceae bacterium]|nr:futalosine hydrolase [Saprospiraceae bacterium]
MKVLIVSATPFEVAPLKDHLAAHFENPSAFHYQKNNLEVKLLVTGVGMAHAAFALGAVFASQKFDLAINAGVAGAFNRSLKIGDVVNVVAEQFGDLGVEEADGRFTDAFELGLIDPPQPPFINGKLYNPSAGEFDFLPKQNGLTVNKVHGTQQSIDAIAQKYKADVESMEGAAFFLACLLTGMNFLEIRAISNFVEPRNREAWDLPLAIGNLNQVLIELIGAF